MFASNLLNSPIASGDTWPGRFFNNTSPFSLINHRVNDKFVFKMFPDVLADYLFIFFICTTALLARRNPGIRLWLHRRIWAPSAASALRFGGWHPYPYGLCHGEALLGVAFAGLFAFWVYYWRVIFTHTEEKARALSHTGVETELAADLLGQVATLLTSFVMFPISRTGLFVNIFGIPFDRCMKYHRVFGTLAFLVMTIHAMVWWGKWLNEGTLSINIFQVNELYLSPTHVVVQNFTIPMIETSWLLLGVTLVMACTLRNRLYILFQYSHKFVGTVFFIIVILHAWSFWYFAAGSLLMWLSDKLVRSVQAACMLVPSKLEWHARSGVVMLRLKRDACVDVQPGQYFNINIPSISLNEWHPFTASAVLPDGIYFYIKAMRPARDAVCGYHRVPWTARLAALVQEAKAIPTVRLGGPYGNTHFDDYANMVLFAGGIGITPMIAIFNDLLRRAMAGQAPRHIKTATLVWMTRSVSDFRLFEEFFALATRAANRTYSDGGSRTRTTATTAATKTASSLTAPRSSQHPLPRAATPLAGRLRKCTAMQRARTL